MAEDIGFFTDGRESQYMAMPRFAMGKKQDVNGLLRRFSGWHVLVLLGATSRKDMANGTPFIKDFIGGVVLGCGNV